MQKSPTGTWLPAWVPESSRTLSWLLMICSAVQSTTGGYDGSMINGLNILDSYNNYFHLENAAYSGLNTSSIFIGAIIASVISGVISDRLGRRIAIFWGSTISIVGIILQTAAQDIGMFVFARIIIGFGTGLSGIAAGVYLTETFAERWRTWGVSVVNNFYYVGALIAAGLTLGTNKIPNSTWAWRVPTLIQGVFSILCIVVLPFVPESPRWLTYQGRFEEARLVVAQANSNGDLSDPVALTVYKEILDTLEFEKKDGRSLGPMEIIKNRKALKRTLIGASVGPFSCIAGNIIASYYLSAELDSAGITDQNKQLLVNVVLNIWSLACACIGTWGLNSWGRRPTAIASWSLLTIFLWLTGGLTKMVADSPNGPSTSLSYAAVAMIFLFQGSYSLGFTPLLYLYPGEVLNYSVRANGMALAQLMLNVPALVLTFVMPIGLANIGWKMYMVNASWDLIVLALIVKYWVETKGKTIEEVDAIFEGQKHSSVPDIEAVRHGERTVTEEEVAKSTAVAAVESA